MGAMPAQSGALWVDALRVLDHQSVLWGALRCSRCGCLIILPLGWAPNAHGFLCARVGALMLPKVNLIRMDSAAPVEHREPPMPYAGPWHVISTQRA